jgi:hypothetical protein
VTEVGGACSTHGETRNEYKGLTGDPEGKRQLKGIGRRKILKGILGKLGLGMRIGFTQLRMQTDGRLSSTQ